MWSWLGWDPACCGLPPSARNNYGYTASACRPSSSWSLSAEVSLSFVQSKFQLELKPLWSNGEAAAIASFRPSMQPGETSQGEISQVATVMHAGVLRYGFKDPKLSRRVIPALTSSASTPVPLASIGPMLVLCMHSAEAAVPMPRRACRADLVTTVNVHAGPHVHAMGLLCNRRRTLHCGLWWLGLLTSSVLSVGRCACCTPHVLT